MQKMIKRMIIVCLLAMIMCVFPITVMAELRIHFINVGQGDSILVVCDDEELALGQELLELLHEATDVSVVKRRV